MLIKYPAASTLFYARPASRSFNGMLYAGKSRSKQRRMRSISVFDPA
jgi:hypothetical protein